jgi:hypothetical protein
MVTVVDTTFSFRTDLVAGDSAVGHVTVVTRVTDGWRDGDEASGRRGVVNTRRVVDARATGGGDNTGNSISHHWTPCGGKAPEGPSPPALK